ncbi:unnamed protein product [Lymnaea stagnalis]|uniref:Uncharacterized protein n=1 Tax=Lymnaea stagnalis TaxID=6523 RepID=A0AAV2HJU2_LYMST
MCVCERELNKGEFNFIYPKNKIVCKYAREHFNQLKWTDYTQHWMSFCAMPTINLIFFKTMFYVKEMTVCLDRHSALNLIVLMGGGGCYILIPFFFLWVSYDLIKIKKTK